MRRDHLRSVSLALLLLALAGCGNSVAPAPVSEPAPTTAPAAEPTLALWEEFNPASFSNPTVIDNQWMPLTPGTKFVYEGTTVEDDGTLLPHRIEIHVTDMTKEIGGIKTVVTWDLDFSDDELVEAELAFFAQDDAGNVWRMGEYPEEYDGGAFVKAPTWIHGLAEARAGIAMQAAPAVGTPSYSQGWGPAVGWTDRGQVDEVVAEVCVPVNCFEDVLVVAETSQAEPDAFQLKYWAPGHGNIRTGWRGAGEKTKEVLELTEKVDLGPAELAIVREEALKLEAHAYAVSSDVYAKTPPLEQAQ